MTEEKKKILQLVLPSGIKHYCKTPRCGKAETLQLNWICAHQYKAKYIMGSLNWHRINLFSTNPNSVTELSHDSSQIRSGHSQVWRVRSAASHMHLERARL